MKLNFFSRVYLAITDFRLYPYVVQKEKFATAFAYFLCFIILVSIILSANATVKVVNWLSDFNEIYDSQVGDFLIKDGRLITNQDMDMEFDGIKLFSDASKSVSDSYIDASDLNKYKLVFHAYQDGVAVGNSKYGYITIKYTDFNLSLNKAMGFKIINTSLNSTLFKVSLVGIIFCGVFASYFVTRFIMVLFITFMLLFLGMVFRTNYHFKDYMKVAFYVITLPTITEIIALLFVGELNQYASITYYLLSYVYMFYAIRALKLDNIIMETQEKILNMKSDKEKTDDKEENKKDNEKK